ncbi:MAG TPA: xanthine dehydrogenase family protein molybdopterin-binding subunit [Cyclobacteriaceae bacterium]
MNTDKNISRRNFIKLTSLSGAALTLGFYFPTKAKEAVVIKGDVAETMGIELNAWISIDPSGKVTIINHRAEMGQGAFQSIPQIIAEELEVDLNQVNIVFGKSNNKKYGSQVTGGSSTIRGSYERLLRLGASAREMLIEAAAKKWNTSSNECYAKNGFVIHKGSEKKLGYGELVVDASKLEPPKQIALKDPKTYTIIRKSLPRQDTPAKVNGQAVFGLDFKLPGMRYALVERSARFEGKVKSFNADEVLKVPGVKHVFKVNREVFENMREGVAVVADTLWAAMQGRKGLKVEWDDTAFPHHSTEDLYTKMKEQLKGDMIAFKAKGNVNDEFGKSDKKIEYIYETPYQSHSCMEPLNCTANVQDNKCEIWGPIQGPDWVQRNLSGYLKLPPENITVHMTFLGGGFGRKAFTDYPFEAAMISKEIKAPVQVVWTREDDMLMGPFRPGMVYQCKAGLDKDGHIVAFETKMAGQNYDMQQPGSDKTDYNESVTEGLPEPYFNAWPHYRFGDVPLESPVPTMWWRSVYASTNGFAYESFIDELAVEAGKDPIEFRRPYLKDRYVPGRYHALMDKLQEVSGWKSRKKNEGYGVAITECFATIVGEVVKVSKGANGKVKIDKVWAVMDCGWYVNPDIIKAQVEGSIVMALGAAIIHETHFKEGKAVEANFNTYKMPRITDIPEIEVHIMDNDEKAGGVGEPGLPPFSPALTNAIFDLTGKRIRKLPFNLEEI